MRQINLFLILRATGSRSSRTHTVTGVGPRGSGEPFEASDACKTLPRNRAQVLTVGVGSRFFQSRTRSSEIGSRTGP